MLRSLVYFSMAELQKLVTSICTSNNACATGTLQKCYRILRLTNESLERVYCNRILIPAIQKENEHVEKMWTSILCILFVATKLDFKMEHIT